MSSRGFFHSPEGRSYAVTFFLVASLFLLWGFCNGMIDVMDKHFQDKLHLTKAQSAWVQTAHCLGGAIIPKLMGALGDHYNMSVGFLMPMGCFGLIAAYGFAWSGLSKAPGLASLPAGRGH
jgi:FHS family L-fucose permease-like MFS transporter